MSSRKDRIMNLRQTICVLVLLTAGAAWAQDNNSQNPTDTQPATPPPAAFGQDGSPVVVNDNPPISGLDQPSLEPNIQPRSMLLGGVEGSESLDSNIGSDATPAWHGVTRGLGGLTMQRLWNRYQLAAAYVGGVGGPVPGGDLQPHLRRTGMVTALAADELICIGVAAFALTLHDADRLASQDDRPPQRRLIMCRHGCLLLRESGPPRPDRRSRESCHRRCGPERRRVRAPHGRLVSRGRAAGSRRPGQ